MSRKWLEVGLMGDEKDRERRVWADGIRPNPMKDRRIVVLFVGLGEGAEGIRPERPGS
ncbi:MAG: hypothetical protein GY910_13780 [bacterium]|nr:hypothetical protein [bacterium]